MCMNTDQSAERQQLLALSGSTRAPHIDDDGEPAPPSANQGLPRSPLSPLRIHTASGLSGAVLSDSALRLSAKAIVGKSTGTGAESTDTEAAILSFALSRVSILLSDSLIVQHTREDPRWAAGSGERGPESCRHDRSAKASHTSAANTGHAGAPGARQPAHPVAQGRGAVGALPAVHASRQARSVSQWPVIRVEE